MGHGTLEEHFVHASGIPHGRMVWRSEPAVSHAPTSAIIFLDAELYIERVAAVGVIRGLQNADEIAAVFISSNSAAARHADFTCNPQYSSFIANDVLPWLLASFPKVDPSRVVVAGLSLSGLAAAFLAVKFPSLFRAAVCQSPSFWWKNQKFSEFVPEIAGPRLWVSVGHRETSKGISHAPSGLLQESTQIEGCDQVCDALRRRGHIVSYRIFDGGHDPDCWREDLDLALRWVWQRA